MVRGEIEKEGTVNIEKAETTKCAKGKPLQRFFAYAVERHKIYLRRKAQQPAPYTTDEILQRYRFTNVFRELDKTTVWFRENVRDRMRDETDVLLATVVFRMLNRIATGEAIFNQTSLHPIKAYEYVENTTAFDLFCEDGDVRHLKRAIKAYCGKGPYVTGAYIITSPPGYTKLDGMMQVIKQFYSIPCPDKLCGYEDWECVAKSLLKTKTGTLQRTWEWLKDRSYIGPFHAYEIVTDLRHTALLCNAVDILSWANPGPGARRGLNRIHGRDVSDHSAKREQLIEEMQSVLSASKTLWPKGKLWPKWEMREVEHTLCEFDKFERVRLGQGRPRGVFK